MKNFNIHYHIIDFIVKIYSEDKTQVIFNDIMRDEIKVTSGIRQGCNGSSSLFLMITYLIIDKLYEKLQGVNTSICKIVALFFADDGLILAQSLKEAKMSIDILTSIATECGLTINKEKSNIMIFNSKYAENTNTDHIAGIKVCNSINYLGIAIDNIRNCFKQHKKNTIKKSMKYSNLMPAVIAKSCNKVLIGKTYWKCAALPSILHGSEIVFFRKDEIENLQKEENKAFRSTVYAYNCTAISALRGDIGASLQRTRDIKTKLLFVKHILRDNDLMKEILLYQLEEKNPSKWITQLKQYMKEVHLNIHMIEIYNSSKIKRIIKEYDDMLWTDDMKDKSTLNIYSKYKTKIKDEQVLYDNTASSGILFKARTGTLPLNDKKRHIIDGCTKCQLCDADYEDIEHFLLHCQALNDTRKKAICLQKPYNENEMDIIADFLLFNETNEDIIEDNKNVLYALWCKRKSITNNIKNNDLIATIKRDKMKRNKRKTKKK